MEYRKISRCKICQGVYNNCLMTETQFEQYLDLHDDADVSVEGDVDIICIRGTCPDCTSDYFVGKEK